VVQRGVQSVPIPTVESESDPTLLPRIVATYTMQKLKRLRQLAVEIHYASVKHPKVRQVLRRSLDEFSVGDESPMANLMPLASTAKVSELRGLAHWRRSDSEQSNNKDY
jgi:hypothetical protein